MSSRSSVKHTLQLALIASLSLSAAPLATAFAAMPRTAHMMPAKTQAPALIHITQTTAQQDKAEAYVKKMTDTAVDFLSNEKLSQDEKTKKFEKLLDDHFDMRSIARFALGRYWRTATPKQQKEYIKLFDNMIVGIYSRRFSDYKGQAIDVVASRPEGKNDMLVSTIIKQDNGPDVQVDWRLRPGKSGLKVIDVVVEGVSMALTQRSDFASVIQRGGGDVQVLLAHLQEK